jgi:hypothetical protein
MLMTVSNPWLDEGRGKEELVKAKSSRVRLPSVLSMEVLAKMV